MILTAVANYSGIKKIGHLRYNYCYLIYSFSALLYAFNNKNVPAHLLLDDNVNAGTAFAWELLGMYSKMSVHPRKCSNWCANHSNTIFIPDNDLYFSKK